MIPTSSKDLSKSIYRLVHLIEENVDMFSIFVEQLIIAQGSGKIENIPEVEFTPKN